MKRAALLALAALVFAVLGSACVDLQEIELGRCGNQVLEAGEDCDSFAEAPGGEICIAAGHPGECRYGCAQGSEGARAECPLGYACGKDDVCRRASGSFEPPVAAGQAARRWMVAADFDGNGDDDLCHLQATQLAIDFLEDGTPRETYRLPLDAEARPIVAEVDSDTAADLLVPTSDGLALWRGHEQRRLLPTTFASSRVNFGTLDFDVVTLDLVPDVVALGDIHTFPGDEPLTLISYGAFASSPLLGYGVAGAEIPDYGYGFDIDAQRGHAVPGRFDETADVHGAYVESPEQFVIALVNEVRLLRPTYFEDDKPGDPHRLFYFVDATTEAATTGPDADPPVPPSHPGPTTVALPAGTELERAPLAVDLNPFHPGFGASAIACPLSGDRAPADAHLDLLLSARVAGEVRLLAAYGLGDGTFTSDPCLLDEIELGSATADNQAAVVPAWSACAEAPLAAGDIDGDGGVDFVLPDAVRLSGRVPQALLDMLGLCDPITAIAHPDGERWSKALVADVNGDGRLDVVASGDDAGVDILTSAPEARLNHARIATTGTPALIRSGDFDGNGLADIALSEPSADGSSELLSVIFGEVGALGTAVLVGSLDEVGEVIPLDIARSGSETTIDGITDLLIAAIDEDAEVRFAFLHGRADRQLHAPFVFALEVAEPGAARRYHGMSAALSTFDVGCEGPALALAGLGRNDTIAPYPPSEPDAILGVACVSDTGDFTPLGSRFSPLPTTAYELSAKDTAITAVSLAEGVVEPVVMGWGASEALVTALALPRPDPERVLVADAAALIEGAVPAGVAPSSAAARSRLWQWAEALIAQPRACRLRADGPEALLFLAVHADGSCAEGSERAATVLHAVPAAVLAGIREGGTLDGAQELRAGEDRTLLGFTCLNADGDADEEVALLVLSGPDPQCDDGDAAPARQLVVELLEADGEGKLGDPVATPIELGEAQLAALGDVFTASPPATGLVRGDFNGDGVDDLALAATPTALLFLGRAVNP